jgi:hypothetical protein
VARAGEELVRDGRIKEETLAAVSQDLAPPSVMEELGRKFWTEAREQAKNT